ncbi:hypothetical protein GCM10027285_25060 [Oleiagrimonas citrea]
MLQRIRRHGAVDAMRVAGYTDRIGSSRYNLDLSRKRAQSVRTYLVREGVPGAVIHAQGGASAIRWSPVRTPIVRVWCVAWRRIGASK